MKSIAGTVVAAVGITCALSVVGAAADAPTDGHGRSALTVQDVELIEVHIPLYCDRVRRHMYRANTHGERVRVYRVELSNGVTGWGESPMDERNRFGRVRGENPFAVMYDDRVGFGVQMALFDAVGKTVGVPAWRLIGRQVRKRVPIAWWAIDMPPDDWAAEVRESVRRGYRDVKLKGRPWRDIYAQIDAVSAAAPEDYRLSIDFNGFLVTNEKATEVLRRLDARPRVHCYESPFYLQNDLDGARRLREAVDNLVVEHFNEKVLRADASDGFLVAANYEGTMRTLHRNSQCATMDKPYWLQMVGTGITTAYMAHLGAVLSHARLPAVTCHELWEDDLLIERLDVTDGTLAVPDAPGLGVKVDVEAIERYRVRVGTPSPRDLARQRKRTVRITIPPAREGGDPTVLEFGGEDEYYQPFLRGEYRGFVPGVRMEIVDGPATRKRGKG